MINFKRLFYLIKADLKVFSRYNFFLLPTLIALIFMAMIIMADKQGVAKLIPEALFIISTLVVFVEMMYFEHVRRTKRIIDAMLLTPVSYLEYLTSRVVCIVLVNILSLFLLVLAAKVMFPAMTINYIQIIVFSSLIGFINLLVAIVVNLMFRTRIILLGMLGGYSLIIYLAIHTFKLDFFNVLVRLLPTTSMYHLLLSTTNIEPLRMLDLLYLLVFMAIIIYGIYIAFNKKDKKVNL